MSTRNVSPFDYMNCLVGGKQNLSPLDWSKLTPQIYIYQGSYHIARSLSERKFSEFTLFKRLAEKSLANK